MLASRGWLCRLSMLPTRQSRSYPIEPLGLLPGNMELVVGKFESFFQKRNKHHFCTVGGQMMGIAVYGNSIFLYNEISGIIHKAGARIAAMNSNRTSIWRF